MTVTYSARVATSKLGTFLKLLLRWRGSVYKLLWRDFLVFTTCYFSLSAIYRFMLNENQKQTFEGVVDYCRSESQLIPMAFVLGFYVSIVISRWWAQVELVPWPDKCAIHVSADVHGNDERSRLMRRNIMRYINLSIVLTLICISPPLKKRFPTLAHLIEAGFMTPEEEVILENIQTSQNKYFVPLVWATSLISRARKENMVKDDYSRQHLLGEITSIRTCLALILNYDWICIPLVYTQVVTLSVYTFFMACLMGRQFTKESDTIDMYVPVFTLFQYIFYMGWLKVAESLSNPFGGDDDDYEVNEVVDRHLQVSYLIVDEMHSDHPELIKDQYWDNVDFSIPYTAATVEYKQQPVYLGSTNEVIVEPQEADFVSSQAEEVEGDADLDASDIQSTTKGSRISGISRDSRLQKTTGTKFSSFIKRAFGNTKVRGNQSNLSLDVTSRRPMVKWTASRRTKSLSRQPTRVAMDFLERHKLVMFKSPLQQPGSDQIPSTDQTMGEQLGTQLVDIPEDRIPDDITGSGRNIITNGDNDSIGSGDYLSCHSSTIDSFPESLYGDASDTASVHVTFSPTVDIVEHADTSNQPPDVDEDRLTGFVIEGILKTPAENEEPEL